MDVMEIRRRLIRQMASSGKNFISGTFTTNNETPWRIPFGKTFNNYMYMIEMTDESKTELSNSGQTSAKMYACCGIYPAPVFGNNSLEKQIISYRVNPSNSELSTSASSIVTCSNNQIEINNNTIGSGANVLYKGYTYKYIIVSLD